METERRLLACEEDAIQKGEQRKMAEILKLFDAGYSLEYIRE
jgi:hypothetical protein